MHCVSTIPSPQRRIAFASLFVFIVLCGELGGSAIAQDDSNAAVDNDPKAAPAVAKHIAVDALKPDDAIEQRLNNVLRATTWFKQVEVEVRDSVVFLNGTAETDEQKEWAGELANNTDGVAAVVNNLKVARVVNFSKTFDVILVSLKNLWQEFLAHSPLILAGLIALLLTWILVKIVHALIRSILSRSKLQSNLRDLVLQLSTIGMWLVGLLVATIIMFPGMTPSRAIAVLGIGSVAIGFAFKDIFENFFAGILILWKYPFDKGDFIECGNVQGKIEDITIRMSMIRQVDGQLVVVPNAFLFSNPVDVLTNESTRRTTITCGVAYDTDLSQAKKVLTDAVVECASVDREHDVEIFAQTLADSSINFEVTWWTGSSPLAIRKSRDEVIRKVKSALDAAGIEIPFPQRTLWLPEPICTEPSA